MTPDERATLILCARSIAETYGISIAADTDDQLGEWQRFMDAMTCPARTEIEVIE